MLAKTALLAWAIGMGAAVALLACAGPVGKGEGDSCSTADDCSSNLQCQPVTGRGGDYCCPAPPSTSKEANCQAVTH
jgi:hypothetical protein